MSRHVSKLMPFIVLALLSASLSWGQTAQDADRLYNEGQELYNKATSPADMEKAVRKFEEALAIRKKLGEKKREAVRLYEEGNELYNKATSRADIEKALKKYEQALSACRKVGEQKGEAVCLASIGAIYNAWGQYANALEYFEKSLPIVVKIGDVHGEGANLLNIGMIYNSLGHYAKALEYFEKTLPIFEKLGDVQGEGTTLNNMGLVYQSWGQYPKALEYYEKSLEIMGKLGDVKSEGTTLNNIAGVYHSWGQYAKALEYYEKSLVITRKIEDVKQEGGTLNNIGMVYVSRGQYTKALEYYEKSLEIRRKLGDVHGEGLILSNIAHVNMAMGKHDQALADLRKTLDIYTRIKVPTDGVKDSIGEAYLEMGDMANAEPFIKEAGDNSSLGRLFLLQSDFQKATTYYEKLLKPAEENRNVDDLFTANTGLGMVCESLQDYSKSEDYYRKAVSGVEDIRSSLGPSERENFFSVKTHGFFRTDPYEGLARVLARMNRPAEGLKHSEYTKARLFSEALSKNAEGAKISVPTDVLQKDSALTNQLAALTKNLRQAYEKGNKEVISVLEPQVKDMKAKLEAHVDMLRKDYPLFAATKYPQPMDLSQTALGENEWCLVYDVTEPGLLIYLTKGKALVKSLFRPVPRKDLDELVRKVREPLEVVSGKDLHVKLKTFDLTVDKRLSDILLTDVLPNLPQGVPVTIVPSGCLGILPFEMLVLNSGGEIKTDGKVPEVSGAEFFGDRNPICYYQSITALTLARTLGKQHKPTDRLLIVADPVFEMKDARAQERKSSSKVTGVEARLYEDLMAAVEDGKVGGLRFNRLPLTADLANDLNESFKDSCAVYTGLKANKEAFVKDIAPNLGDYSKVVFATHGYFGKGLPGINEPVLVLSLVPPGTDGYLRMSEVMGLKMNADMVALTACQTGLGKALSGEGVMGMGRAFQYAGAKSVFMSLWSVSEKSSVMLVESFFRNLKEGKPKLEALKLARNEVRGQGYDHPFFWAGFILVGEAN